MGREIRKRCAYATSIRIVSVSGESYEDFVSQIKQGRDTVEAPRDTYILFGGWEDDSRPIEFSTDRTRRIDKIWAAEFACVSVGSSRGDNRWGETGTSGEPGIDGEAGILAETGIAGGHGIAGPLWICNRPKIVGAGIKQIRPLRLRADREAKVSGKLRRPRGDRSKKFICERESICVWRPTQSTEDLEDMGAAGLRKSIEVIDFTGAKC